MSFKFDSYVKIKPFYETAKSFIIFFLNLSSFPGAPFGAPGKDDKFSKSNGTRGAGCRM